MIEWDTRRGRNITATPEVAGPAGRRLLEMGWEVARDAAVRAPRRTGGGGGARSIHPELVLVAGVPEVRISWDRRHFYMSFAELGTSHESPRPFLRPALDRFKGG